MRQPISLFAALAIGIAAAGCAEPAAPELVDSTPAAQLQCASIEPVPAAATLAAVAASDSAICVRIPAGSGVHAIAYHDARSIEQARTQPEPVLEPFGAFDIIVSGVAVASMPLTTGMSFADVAGGDHAMPHGDDMLSESVALTCEHPMSDVICRTQAWVVGDTIMAVVPGGRGVNRTRAAAEVFAIGGRYVFAVQTSDRQLLPPAWIAEYREVGVRMTRDVDPIINEAFTVAQPTTNAAGQVLVVLDRNSGYVSGEMLGDTFRGWVRLPLLGGLAFQHQEQAIDLLAHEITHLSQSQQVRDAQRTQWGAEGAATFIACEAGRRVGGVPLASNSDLDAPGVPSDMGATYERMCLMKGDGHISRGYTPAARMMRAWREDLLRRGIPNQDAVRTISLGAIEGWFGAAQPAAGRGLVAHLSALTGAPWDPIANVLAATMRTALDDRSANPALQVDDQYRAWLIWRPERTYRPAAADDVVEQAEIPGGSTGYFYILADPEREAVIKLAPSVRGVRWLVGRAAALTRQDAKSPGND